MAVSVAAIAVRTVGVTATGDVEAAEAAAAGSSQAQSQAQSPASAASLVLVLATAAVTLVTSDIGLPAGLSGSILGGFVVYVLPAVVKWQSAQACTDKLTCLSLAALGIVLAYLGASQTLAQYGFL